MVEPVHLRETEPAFDPGRRYVRARAWRADGFVEFDFAIGSPDLSVELILPAAEFHEFCRANRVVHVTPAEGERLDRERVKWSQGDRDAEP